ncbi:hypothetical protein AB0A95_30545 [Micromonospora sp. NPDC049230]|uniref:hypothetical protein n=1 Tax=Micromonospora sp. NPDC049230 TaxID=3155502 RepID=UPI0033D1BA85
MATEVAPPTRWLADEWENRSGYASAVLSGIVPDERHKKNGGYHPSIEDLIRYGNGGDYSNSRPLDKAPPVTAKGKKYGAAVDMSLSRADMKKLYGRALAVYNNRSDPRRRYLNAINVWDGITGHSPRRLDFQANTNSTASKDHEWHSHEDQPRAYVDVNRNEQEAWTAARAFISMVKGESAAQWLASIGQGEDDDMGQLEGAQAKWLERAAQLADWMLNADYKGFAIRDANGKLGPVEPLVKRLADLLFAMVAGPGGSGAFVADFFREQQLTNAAMRSALEGLLQQVQAGGGNVDSARILAGVDAVVADAVQTMRAETRDAVADLGEGGAAQVRADT